MGNNDDYPPYYSDENDRRGDGLRSHHDTNDDARYNDNGFHSMRDDCPRPRDPYVRDSSKSSPSDFTYGPGSSVTSERRAEEEIDRQYRDMENSGILPTNSNGMIDDPYAPVSSQRYAAPEGMLIEQSRRYNAPEGMPTEQGRRYTAPEGMPTEQGGHNYYNNDIIPPQPLIDRRESTTAINHDDVRNKRSFQYGPKSSVALDSGVSIDTSSSDQGVDRTRYRKNDNVGRMMPPPLNINNDERMMPPPHSNDRMIPPPSSDQAQARYRENGMNIDDDERMIHPPPSNERMVPPHPNDRMNNRMNDRMNPPHSRDDRMNPPHPNDRMNPPPHSNDRMTPPLRSHHDNDRTIPPPSSNDRTMPPPNGNIEDDYHRGRDPRMEDPIRRDGERPRMMDDIDNDYRRGDPRMEDPSRRERERPGMMDVDDTTTFHRRTPSSHHDNNRRRNDSNEHTGIGEAYVRRTNNDDNNNSRRSMNYDNRPQGQYNNNDNGDRRRSTSSSSSKQNSYNKQKNNNNKDVIIDEDHDNDNNFGDVLQRDIDILQQVVNDSMNSKIPEVLKSALDAREQINELVALQRLNLERSICKLESSIDSMELSPLKIDACTELQHMQRQLQELSSTNDIDDMPFNDNGNRMSRQNLRNLDNGEDDYPERRRMRMNEDRPSPKSSFNEDRPSPRSRFKDIDVDVDDFNSDRRNGPSDGRQRDTSRPNGRGRKDDTRSHRSDVDTDSDHPYDPVISIRSGNTTYTRPLSAPPFQYGPGSSIASAQAELDYGASNQEHKEEDEDRVRVQDNLFIYDINDDDDSTIITTTSSYDDDKDDEDSLDKDDDDDDDILRTRLPEDDDIDSLMAKRREKRKQRCD
eukprot:CAMPEP_0194195012 /NCGR_PEP_ID=MMETSP0154-20130528/75899_1 /TAXON_ID=1049557 /ORGANISM="Thalassiothrix antarctica, Strain L6-D1" /LENGTH=855 /DNA_ID=CAMNT_0038919497 /DNA_START=341 /DNA_END=2908 /DNA_ORIENTATION=+